LADSDQVVEDCHREKDSVMGGSSREDTKTTTEQLTPEQQGLVSMAMPYWSQFAGSNPTLPTGDQAVAQFDPLQTAGQERVLQGADTAQGVVGDAAARNRYMTSGALMDVGNNQYVKDAAAAAVDPLYQNLGRVILPGIDTSASTGAGGVSANFGGSRHGIAEGMAINDTQRQAGNTSANVFNNAYNTGVGATNQAIGMAPSIAAAQSIPGGMVSTVGDVRQQRAQALLDAQNANSQLQQWLPLLKAQMLTQGSGALKGGTTTSHGTSNEDANPVSQVIGGASAVGGLMGGLSKLLPLLSLSDRRLKRNIQYLHTSAAGFRWYRFEYLWGGESHVGVMAQEVRKIRPSAVVDLGGVLAVDYAQVS
jgi:hypothetical protein